MLPYIQNYKPTDPSLWQGRKDSLPGERFFQHVQCVDVRTHLFSEPENRSIILGFCSDEGIRRNEGRIGAKEGPEQLRQQFGKLACHSQKELIDVGNIVCSNDQLEIAQQNFAELIHYSHQLRYKTVAFGGGHEIAWAHFQGLIPHYPKIGIINFDAHFDIRPLHKNGRGTSGTPFWQIREYCLQNQFAFDYCCLGIQFASNTRSLLERAREWNISFLTAEQIHTQHFAWQCGFLDDFLSRHDHVYLSICMDVFSECYAPGVSAPQAIGLTPWQVLPLLKYITQTGKVVSIDIAELSPPLDQENKTARLAALLLAELLNT